MARRLIFKESGLTGSVPSGYKAIGFNGLTFSQLSSAGSFSNVGSSSGGGGLTNFVDAVSTASPNATVNAVSLTATASTANADAVIVPKGTGAFLTAVPDGLTSGGSKRGQYAVDLQMVRNANYRIASGNRSVIIGGYNNGATNTYSIVGGESNQSLGYASVVFGASNLANTNAAYGVCLGSNNQNDGQSSVCLGDSNTITSGRGAALAAGGNNTVSTTGGYQTALGYFNTVSNNVGVGIGYQNTSSGSAAVALGQQNTSSGSNSAAIGQSNVSSGSNSSTMGYGNSNAGTFASFAVGWSNTITSGGVAAFAVGQQNGVSAQGYAIGVQNSVANGYALGTTNTVNFGVAIGQSNTADGSVAIAMGIQSTSFGIRGRLTFASGQMSTLGDSQKSSFILQIRTTNNTASTMITWYGSSITPYVINQIMLQNNNTIGFKGVVVAKQSASSNSAMWEIKGLITRGSSAGATSLLYSEITQVSNSPGWGGPTFSANTGYGLLEVQAIGATATNIQWTASIETTEVIYS